MGERLFFKRLVAVALAVCFLLQLSGCSVTGLDVQTLISPPKNNADQQAIHDLMQQGESETTFVYPKRGEFRSAITIRSLTGDDESQAIGFLLSESTVVVKFLYMDQGVWKLKSSFQNPVTQVDRICFGDVNGDGVEEVIIGWGDTSNTMSASVSVYFYQEERVKEVPLTQKYGDMTLTDMDGDGILELFLLQREVVAEEENAEGHPAQAELISLKDAKDADTAVSISTVEADNTIVKFSSILTGKITSQLTGVVADGAKADNSMTTQIFFLNEAGKLETYPKNVNDAQTVNPFYRSPGTTFISKDINGDGIIDIPVVSLLPLIPQGTVVDSTACLVQWSNYSHVTRESFRSVAIALMNLSEGYWFSPTASMKHKLSTSNDSKKHSVVYYEVITDEKGQEPALGELLFTIRVFSETAWEQRGVPAGYEKLAAQNGKVYGIHIATKDTKYHIFLERVKSSFTLIND